MLIGERDESLKDREIERETFIAEVELRGRLTIDRCIVQLKHH
jgi:hypothetical protein